MLHLRIITPPDLTTAVLRELADDPGVTHITVDRGAATQPPGDLVACDVVRASVTRCSGGSGRPAWPRAVSRRLSPTQARSSNS
jgi:hypothetical protein